jgi:hypothetical protein
VDKNATFPLNGTYWTQQLEADPPDAALQRELPAAVRGELVTHRKLLRESDRARLERHRNQSGRLFRRRDRGEHQPEALLYLQNPDQGRYFASVTQLNMDGSRNMTASSSQSRSV